MVVCDTMRYLPKPDLDRTAQDVDEIYALTAEELQHARDPESRRRIFRTALLRSYEAGIDAQREMYRDMPPDPSQDTTRRLRRPVPTVPPEKAPADDDTTDPSMQLPLGGPWKKH